MRALKVTSCCGHGFIMTVEGGTAASGQLLQVV